MPDDAALDAVVHVGSSGADDRDLRLLNEQDVAVRQAKRQEWILSSLRRSSGSSGSRAEPREWLHEDVALEALGRSPA